MMNRREALSRVALIMGGTVLGAEAFLSGCTTGAAGLKFSQDDISFLNEVAETILPATGTPGWERHSWKLVQQNALLF